MNLNRIPPLAGLGNLVSGSSEFTEKGQGYKPLPEMLMSIYFNLHK